MQRHVLCVASERPRPGSRGHDVGRLGDGPPPASLLPRTPLLPDTEHRFRLRATESAANVRLDIYPDGGLSRLRLNGFVAPEARDAVAQRWLALLPAGLAVASDEFFD